MENRMFYGIYLTNCTWSPSILVRHGLANGLGLHQSIEPTPILTKLIYNYLL